MEYAWLARHMDPEVCGIGAIFLHLFYRFHVIGHAPPDLVNRSFLVACPRGPGD